AEILTVFDHKDHGQNGGPVLSEFGVSPDNWLIYQEIAQVADTGSGVAILFGGSSLFNKVKTTITEAFSSSAASLVTTQNFCDFMKPDELEFARQVVYAINQSDTHPKVKWALTFFLMRLNWTIAVQTICLAFKSLPKFSRDSVACFNCNSDTAPKKHICLPNWKQASLDLSVWSDFH
ncbi:hypothetical protein, partial [Planktotalea sp.]|uniref:hypothetical protein n=1 Tax=Planktotalea sp. TaxID=2029877 RepID=UPI0035C85CBF